MPIKAQSLIVLALALALSGCGDSNVFSSMADDSSSAAKTQQGLDALNSEDYSEAITTFEALNNQNPDDPEIIKYLASAYVGSTGFDVLDLVNILAEADESGSNDDRDMFETIGDLFDGDQDGIISDLGTKIDMVNQAIDLLAPAGIPSQEAEFQAGLYSAVQAVLVTSSILDGANIDTVSDSDVDSLVPANFNGNSEILDPATGLPLTNGQLLNKSLAVATQTKDSLLEGLADGEDRNNLGEDFDEFLSDIGYVDENDPVIETDLVTYLKQI